MDPQATDGLRVPLGLDPVAPDAVAVALHGYQLLTRATNCANFSTEQSSVNTRQWSTG